MYKHFYLLFFIFFQIKFQAQNNFQNILGNWTNVKIRTIDGSKDLSEKYSISKFYSWQINSSKICMRTESVYKKQNNCFEYTLDNDIIRTSPTAGYKIEKIDNDSLIISEKIDGITQKDIVKKLWFVKSSKILRNEIEKNFSDSILIAYPFFTPQLKEDFIPEVAKNFINKGSFPSLLFKGNIIIYPKQQKIEFKSDDISINENKNFLFIKNVAENSFKNWDLSDFQNFNKVYIPFIFQSKMEKVKSGGTFKSVNIYFFMDDFENISKMYGPKMEDLELAQKNFTKAVSYLKSNKFDKAIDLFNKGFELNPTKVDALYNIVSIYSKLKDTDNMCLTLKRLKELEQTDGTKLYNEYCTK